MTLRHLHNSSAKIAIRVVKNRAHADWSSTCRTLTLQKNWLFFGGAQELYPLPKRNDVGTTRKKRNRIHRFITTKRSLVSLPFIHSSAIINPSSTAENKQATLLARTNTNNAQFLPTQDFDGDILLVRDVRFTQGTVFSSLLSKEITKPQFSGRLQQSCADLSILDAS